MTRHSLTMLMVAATIGTCGCGNNTATMQEPPPVAADQKWYANKLHGEGEYVVDFILGPHQAQQVAIDADEELLVAFKTDAGFDTIKKYLQTPPKETILMTQTDTDVCFAGITGGQTFSPVNGRIALVVSNQLPETFRIVVCSELPESNKAN